MPVPEADKADSTALTILTRVLKDSSMSSVVAKYLLSTGFSDSDKARMHDLAARNQNDDLTPAEKKELFAFAEAGTMLSILKVRARRALASKPQKRKSK